MVPPILIKALVRFAAVVLVAAAVQVSLASVASAQHQTDQWPPLPQTLRPEDIKIVLEFAVLYRSGRYAEAIPLAQKLLGIYEREFGPDHLKVATALQNLADLHSKQGRYDDAESLYKRSLAIKEKALGPDNPDVALSLHNSYHFHSCD